MMAKLTEISPLHFPIPILLLRHLPRMSNPPMSMSAMACDIIRIPIFVQVLDAIGLGLSLLVLVSFGAADHESVGVPGDGGTRDEEGVAEGWRCEGHCRGEELELELDLHGCGGRIAYCAVWVGDEDG